MFQFFRYFLPQLTLKQNSTCAGTGQENLIWKEGVPIAGLRRVFFSAFQAANNQRYIGFFTPASHWRCVKLLASLKNY